MSTVLDPLADAVNTAESIGVLFGRLDVDGQYVILRKGERKRVWVEGDPLDGRVSEITLRLNPLDVSKMTYMTERQVLANSGEWSKIVWPSLRDLGIKSLYDVRGKWAKVTMVKNGETYVAKQGAKAGQTVEKTTFKFLGIYNTEAEAVQAWESQFGTAQAHTSSSNGNDAAAETVSQAQPETPVITREQAAMFLPHYVKRAGGDISELERILAAEKMFARFFTVTSPEVLALIKAD